MVQVLDEHQQLVLSINSSLLLHRIPSVHEEEIFTENSANNISRDILYRTDSKLTKDPS